MLIVEYKHCRLVSKARISFVTNKLSLPYSAVYQEMQVIKSRLCKFMKIFVVKKKK
jgi:hypothetical protein